MPSRAFTCEVEWVKGGETGEREREKRTEGGRREEGVLRRSLRRRLRGVLMYGHAMGRRDGKRHGRRG